MNRFVISMLTGILCTSAIAGSDRLFQDLRPNPGYTPEEVAGIQMRALGSNDVPYPDAGIELAFRFASPDNKAVTGPVQRFRTLFASPAYKPMLNHQQLEIGEPVFVGAQAMVPISIVDGDGRQINYVFSLSRQAAAPFVDCWMTDGVARMRVANDDLMVM